MRTETYRWKALADYNAERARGIAHTPEYQERMATEQVAFDHEQGLDLRCPTCGGNHGIWTLSDGLGGRMGTHIAMDCGAPNHGAKALSVPRRRRWWSRAQ